MPDYVWSLDVTYPEDSQREHPVFGKLFTPGWEPPNWSPDEGYIERFKTDRFVWPTVRRFYLSRSAAVNRANLLERYGCSVRLKRSCALVFEERDFKHANRSLRLVPAGAS